jgi:hypothetical protein
MGFIRRWLGLCDHRWVYVSEIIMTEGHFAVRWCNKCKRTWCLR